MQRDWLCHTVHGQIAQNIAGLRTGLFHASALECDLRILFNREKFRAAQMIVALLDSGVDAADIDPCRDRRVSRVLTVDVDLAIEFGELSVRRAQKLVNRKPDRGMRLIELIGFVRARDRT